MALSKINTDALSDELKKGSIGGSIVGAVADADYIVHQYIHYAGTVTDLYCKLSSGTATVTVKVNGVAITGLSVSASSTEATDQPTAGNGAFAIGDTIALSISSGSSPEDLSFSILTSAT